MLKPQKHLRAVLAAVLAALGLCACGQSGPLYLPPKTTLTGAVPTRSIPLASLTLTHWPQGRTVL
ncbi:MAG: hypothetical protein EBT37_11785 [Betaproteobacteria bacterium]|nr:hypothetical protein [Betaproteobacteria bacterium]